MTTIYVPSDWSRALREFTLRNAGRTVSVELQNEQGVFPEPARFALQEAVYDRREGRIEIKLRPLQGDAGVHVRRIADVRDLDIVAAATGRTLALRITHGGGQTVLRFQN
jgi:hypothetical protein